MGLDLFVPAPQGRRGRDPRRLCHPPPRLRGAGQDRRAPPLRHLQRGSPAPEPAGHLPALPRDRELSTAASSEGMLAGRRAGPEGEEPHPPARRRRRRRGRRRSDPAVPASMFVSFRGRHRGDHHRASRGGLQAKLQAGRGREGPPPAPGAATCSRSPAGRKDGPVDEVIHADAVILAIPAYDAADLLRRRLPDGGRHPGHGPVCQHGHHVAGLQARATSLERLARLRRPGRPGARSDRSTPSPGRPPSSTTARPKGTRCCASSSAARAAPAACSWTTTSSCAWSRGNCETSWASPRSRCSTASTGGSGQSAVRRGAPHPSGRPGASAAAGAVGHRQPVPRRRHARLRAPGPDDRRSRGRATQSSAKERTVNIVGIGTALCRSEDPHARRASTVR